MYLSMAKLMGGSFCSNDFKAIKRQLRSVFTSTFSLEEPTPREPEKKIQEGQEIKIRRLFKLGK